MLDNLTSNELSGRIVVACKRSFRGGVGSGSSSTSPLSQILIRNDKLRAANGEI